jgi:ribosome-binding protein aMBF1 (putative translation factor)
MAIESIYPDSHRPLYIEATDAYLSSLPDTDTFNTPAQLAKAGPEATEDMLRRAGEAVKKIEVAKRALAYYAAVLDKLNQNYPDAVRRLPEDQQVAIKDLASRVEKREEVKVQVSQDWDS